MEDPLSTRSLNEERVRPHLDSNPFFLFLYFIVFFFSFFFFHAMKPKQVGNV